MLYRDKRRCPHCQEKISAKAIACPRCTRDVKPVKALSLGKLTVVAFLAPFMYGVYASSSSQSGTVPRVVPGSNGAPTTHVRCVYNRGDGRFIGAFLSARPAPDGVNQRVIVMVDPELDPSGNIKPGTKWEVTVPRNATVGACRTR